MSKKKTLARQTAELIAADLFSYGPEKARRLVMEFHDHCHGSTVGWCEAAVADRVEEVLLRKHLSIWLETKQIQKAHKKG